MLSHALQNGPPSLTELERSSALRTKKERSFEYRRRFLRRSARGRPADAAVHRVLNGRGIVVVDLVASTVRRAGALLARARLGSAHAVDAFVVATAIEFGSAVIATGDPEDMGRLSAGLRDVRVFAI